MYKNCPSCCCMLALGADAHAGMPAAAAPPPRRTLFPRGGEP